MPSTPDTRGLMSRERLARLPQGAGVVNVGRADVFDDVALREGLADGHLGGAVLDVFPIEPLPAAHPLWETPRLIMTPHCSLDDHDNYMRRCVDIFLDNLGRYRRGDVLNNRVDLGLGY
ncbi:NAD(P)-dependent oxidoreductase [Salinicola avicenniae]|uniref:NAD(P)-dependent oxidoreductase n=1 Tax=Salinicola avicenniae TaxID=2916836 RepID=UPI002074A656|nr:NAD(P)-dependent oxidoreductase [Salinicola sp. S1-1-2]